MDKLVLEYFNLAKYYPDRTKKQIGQVLTLIFENYLNSLKEEEKILTLPQKISEIDINILKSGKSTILICILTLSDNLQVITKLYKSESSFLTIHYATVEDYKLKRSLHKFEINNYDVEVRLVEVLGIGSFIHNNSNYQVLLQEYSLGKSLKMELLPKFPLILSKSFISISKEGYILDPSPMNYLYRKKDTEREILLEYVDLIYNKKQGILDLAKNLDIMLKIKTDYKLLDEL